MTASTGASTREGYRREAITGTALTTPLQGRRAASESNYGYQAYEDAVNAKWVEVVGREVADKKAD